jgi:hypothetical protein
VGSPKRFQKGVGSLGPATSFLWNRNVLYGTATPELSAEKRINIIYSASGTSIDPRCEEFERRGIAASGTDTE